MLSGIEDLMYVRSMGPAVDRGAFCKYGGTLSSPGTLWNAVKPPEPPGVLYDSCRAPRWVRRENTAPVREPRASRCQTNRYVYVPS